MTLQPTTTSKIITTILLNEVYQFWVKMIRPYLDSSWNVMAHGDAWEGKWRGNWRMEWVASTLHTTSEHGVSNITTADAHTSAASSRLNWRPRRFKWTRPFCRKTKSGFCACAITFQLASTTCLRRVWGFIVTTVYFSLLKRGALTGLIFSNCTLCPHCICFVFIWEQTATCVTYSINWFVFITEMKSVHSAVRTGYLNKAVCASSSEG